MKTVETQHGIVWDQEPTLNSAIKLLQIQTHIPASCFQNVHIPFISKYWVSLVNVKNTKCQKHKMSKHKLTAATTNNHEAVVAWTKSCSDRRREKGRGKKIAMENQMSQGSKVAGFLPQNENHAFVCTLDSQTAIFLFWTWLLSESVLPHTAVCCCVHTHTSNSSKIGAFAIMLARVESKRNAEQPQIPPQNHKHYLREI